MNLESEYWGCGGAGGGMRDPYQQHFDQNPPHRTNCPEQEVTLAKISTLEDDYSKMKRALLSSMDEEEEEEEEEDVRDPAQGFNDVRASTSSKLPHVNSSSSRSSSRSFNPEPPSNLRDNLSSRQAAHGKALNVESVDDKKLELRGFVPPELKHDERDVLARASNTERSKEKGRRANNFCMKNTTTTTTNTTSSKNTCMLKILLIGWNALLASCDNLGFNLFKTNIQFAKRN